MTSPIQPSEVAESMVGEEDPGAALDMVLPPAQPLPMDVSGLLEIARDHGVLVEGSPMPPELLSYTTAIVELCAIIGDQYGDADGNAGQDIRRVLGSVKLD